MIVQKDLLNVVVMQEMIMNTQKKVQANMRFDFIP